MIVLTSKALRSKIPQNNLQTSCIPRFCDRFDKMADSWLRMLRKLLSTLTVVSAGRRTQVATQRATPDSPKANETPVLFKILLFFSLFDFSFWFTIKMHRAYQPITPANNKLLKKRWDMSRYDTHRRKVCFAFRRHGAPVSNLGFICFQNYSLHNCLHTFCPQVLSAKAVIDNKPPQTYMHLHLKLKKLQVL